MSRDTIVLFRNYLESKSSTLSTVKNYVTDLRHLQKWFTEIKKEPFDASLLSGNDIAAFKAYLEDAKYTPATIERRMSSLRKYFQFLKDQNFITENPTKTVFSEALAKEDPYFLTDFKNSLYTASFEPNTIKNYLVDLTNFFSWLDEVVDSYEIDNKSKLLRITPDLLSEYKKRLIEVARLSPLSVNRKLSALRKYCQWAFEKGFLVENPFVSNVILRPEAEESGSGETTYSDFPPARVAQKMVRALDNVVVVPLANFMLDMRNEDTPRLGRYLKTKQTEGQFFSPYRPAGFHGLSKGLLIAGAIGIVGTLGFFAYQQSQSPSAKPTQQITDKKAPTRQQYEFSGRLLDNNGNPITTQTLVVFSFYDDPESFDNLLHQEAHRVTPNQEGFFSQALDVPEALLLSQTPVYLGIAVSGDAEMRPRTLIAGQGATALFDQNGSFVIANESPSFVASSGTFSIVADSVLIKTTPDSNGSIVLWPDGEGKIDLLGELTNSITGVVGISDSLSINANSGSDPLSVSVGGISALRVDTLGNTISGGNLSVLGATNIQSLTTTDATILGSLSNLATGGLYGIWYDDADTPGEFRGRAVLQKVLPGVSYSGFSPSSGLTDQSVKIVGFVKSNYSETYTFYVTAPDGIRLWVKHTLLIDTWQNQNETTYTGTVTLENNRWHPIIIEHYRDGSLDSLKLEWSSSSQARQVIPKENLAYSLAEVPQTLFTDVEIDRDLSVGRSFSVGSNASIAGTLNVTGLTTLTSLTTNSTLTFNNLSAQTGSQLCLTTSSVVGTCAAGSGVSGNGTTNFLPIWTSATALGNSDIYQIGGNVGIGTTNPGTAKLAIIGGNVGIGTTSPNSALEIVGAAIVNGNLTGTGNLQINSDTTLTGDLAVNGGDLTTTATTFNLINTTATTVNLAGAASALTVGATTGTGVYRNAISSFLGNVGIGTSTPGARLAVAGGGLVGYLGTETAPTNGLAVLGNVGIGTTSPQYNLHIVGTANITGAATIDGNVSLGDSTSDTVAVNGRITTSVVPNLTASVDLGTTALRWNNIWAQTINTTGTNTSGQASFTYDPANTNFSEATVLINPTTADANDTLLGIGVAGVEKAGIDMEGDLVVGYSSSTAPLVSNPFNVYNHGTTRVAYIDTTGTGYFAGNVGIGSSNPGARLQVGGNATIGFAEGTAGPAQGLAVLGNVGIGTSSPQYNLHVVGTTNITGTASFTGNLNPGADDTYDLGSSSLRWRDLYLGPTSLNLVCTAGECTTERNWKIGVQEDSTGEGNLRVVLGGVDYINVNPSGNVGIGTTNPGTLLTLSSSSLTGLGSTAIDFLRLQAPGGSTNYRVGLASDTSFLYFDNGLGSQPELVLTSGGNVGIGTTGPGALLDVRGSAIFNEDGADADFRIESDTNENAFLLDAGKFSGVGQVLIGASGSNFGYTVVRNPALTSVASTDFSIFRVHPAAAVTIPAGTTNIASGIGIATPTFSESGSTLTNAASLWIESAPAGDATNNYALWVDAGDTRLDGDLDVQGGDITSTATTFNLLDSTATTLNIGGAATTVNIGSGELVIDSATTGSANRSGISVRNNGSGITLSDSATANYRAIQSTSLNVTFAGATTPVTASSAHFYNAGTTLVSSGGAKVIEQFATFLGQPARASTDITITDNATFRASNADANINNGAVTNQYGLYVASLTSGTNDYGIYVAGADTYALWSDSGTNRFDGETFLAMSTGNVGIGTSTPSQLLHLSKSEDPMISITRGTTAKVLLGDSGSSNTGDLLLYNSSGVLSTLIRGGADSYITNGKLVVGSSSSGGSNLNSSNNFSVGGTYFATAAPTNGVIIEGNVGIGASLPLEQLHIYNNSSSLGTARFENAGSGGQRLYVQGTTGDAWIHFGDDTTNWSAGIDNSNNDSFVISRATTLGTNDSFVINTSGNVGIGTTGPTQKLEVAGSGLFTGATVQISNAAPQFVLTDTSDGGDNRIRQVNSETAIDVDYGNEVSSSSFSLYIDGTASTNWIFDMSTSAVVFNQNGNDTDFRIESDADANAFVLDAGLDAFAIGGTINGRTYFGLGAVGTKAFTSVVTTGQDIESAFLHIRPASVANSDGPGDLFTAFIAGASLNPTAGDTADLGASLYIEAPSEGGAGAITSMSTVYIANAPSGGATNNYALWVDAGDSRFDGNVGIGDASPDYKLDIEGTGARLLHVSGTSGSDYIANFNITDTTTPYGFLIDAPVGADAGYPLINATVGSSMNFRVDTGAYTGMLVNSSGNVGIGTTNPAAGRLQVGGATPIILAKADSGEAYVRADAAGTDDVFFGLFKGGTTRWNIGAREGSDDLRFYEDGLTTIRMVIQDTTGNVGIGTSSPQYNLHVVGTTNITGTASFTGNLNPSADDTYDLGSSSLRWRDLYLGPTSLNLVCTAGECTTARNWKIGVQEDSTGEGNLRVALGGVDYINVNPSGNVGIGTTAPATALEVVGTSRITRTGVPTQYLDLLATGGSALIRSAANVPLELGVNGTHVQIDSNGNVGIGDANNLLSALHVIGTGTGTGLSLLTQNSTRNNFGLAVLDNGNVGIGTTGPANNLEISFSNQNNNNSGINISNTGAGGWGGSINFKGTVSGASPNFYTMARISSENTGSQGGGLIDFMIPTGNTSTAAVHTMRLKDGNVGIGITTPQHTLHVSDTSNQNNILWLGINSAGQGNMRLGNSSGDGTGVAEIQGYSSNTQSTLSLNRSGGNVGIGTASPSRLLELENSTDALIGLQILETGNNASAAQSAAIRLGFTPSSGESFGEIRLEENGTTNEFNGNMIFSVPDHAGTGLQTPTEKMRIMYNGNVGIGTTAPTEDLHIDASTATFKLDSTGDNAATAVFDSGSSAAQISQLILRDRGTDKYSIRKNSSNNFDIVDADSSTTPFLIEDATPTNTLYLENSGNVGVGNPNPNYKFHVQRASGNSANFDIFSGDNTQWMGINSNTGSGSWNPLVSAGDHAIIYSDGTVDTGSLLIGPWSASSKGIKINSNGNVGIGTGSPESILEVSKLSSGGIGGEIYLTNTSNSVAAGAAVTFRAQNNSLAYVSARIYTDHRDGTVGGEDDRLILSNRVNGAMTDLLTLSHTGNVGIGTTNPTQKFEIQGTGNQTLELATVTSGNATIRMHNQGSNIFGFKTYRSPPNILTIEDFSTGSENTIMAFDSNGNVGIGTTAPTAPFHVVSGGNNFKMGSATGLQVVTTGSTAWTNLGTTASGTEILRWYNSSNSGIGVITGGGNMGIGTVSPQTSLTVGSISAGTAEATNKGSIQIQSAGGSSALGGGGLEFKTSASSNGYGWHIGAPDLLSGNVPLIFSYRNNNATWTNLMTMRSDSGNIGIGTTGPANSLHVFTNQNAGTDIRIANISGGGSMSTGLRILQGSQTNGAYLNINNNGELNINMIENESINFLTNNAQRMIISAGGNVGIGTASPIAKLNLFGTAASTGVNLLTQSSVGAFGLAVLDNGNVGIGTTGPGSKLDVQGAGGNKLLNIAASSAGTGIVYGTVGNTGATAVFGVESSTGGNLVTGGLANAAVFGAQSATALQLASSNTARLTIDTSGNVGIGTASPGALLSVFKSTATALTSSITNTFSTDNTDAILRLGTGVTNSSNNVKYLRFVAGATTDADGTLVGTVTLNGTAAVAYNTSSDQRLKDNITATHFGLADLNNIEVTDYSFKNDPGQSLRTGFIAQQLYTIYPEAVSVGGDDPNDDPWQVDYGKLTPLLVKSVQELDQKISSQAGLTDITDFSLVPVDISEQTPEFTIYDAVGETVDRVAAYSDAIIGNLEAGTIVAQFAQIGDLVAQQLTVDNLTVDNKIVSPLAEFDTVRANVISPLATDTVTVDGRLVIARSEATRQSGQIATGSASLRDDILFEVYGSASISAELIADIVTANGISSEELVVTNDATISGTLRAGKIVADEIVGLQGQIAALAAQTLSGMQTASGSGNLNIEASDSGTLSIDTILATSGSFLEGLLAIGPSGFSDVSISGILSLGSQFILSDNSINVLGGDLKLQPLAQGGVSIADGRVYIDSSGNVRIDGNLDVAGTLTADNAKINTLQSGIISPIPDSDLAFNLSPTSSLVVKDASGSAVLQITDGGNLTASGSATFKDIATQKLTLPAIVQQVDAAGLSQAGLGSVGQATLPGGTFEITIETPFVTESSLVYITPTSDTIGMVPYIARQAPGESFTVAIPDWVEQDITFNWWIIN